MVHDTYADAAVAEDTRRTATHSPPVTAVLDVAESQVVPDALIWHWSLVEYETDPHVPEPRTTVKVSEPPGAAELRQFMFSKVAVPSRGAATFASVPSISPGQM
jgi:hypothetical protein